MEGKSGCSINVQCTYRRLGPTTHNTCVVPHHPLLFSFSLFSFRYSIDWSFTLYIPPYSYPIPILFCYSFSTALCTCYCSFSFFPFFHPHLLLSAKILHHTTLHRSNHTIASSPLTTGWFAFLSQSSQNSTFLTSEQSFYLKGFPIQHFDYYPDIHLRFSRLLLLLLCVCGFLSFFVFPPCGYFSNTFKTSLIFLFFTFFFYPSGLWLFFPWFILSLYLVLLHTLQGCADQTYYSCSQR